MALPGSSFCNRQQFDDIMVIITFSLSFPSLYALYYSLPLLLFLDLRFRYPVLGYSAPSPPFSIFFFLNFPVAFNLFSSPRAFTAFSIASLDHPRRGCLPALLLPCALPRSSCHSCSPPLVPLHPSSITTIIMPKQHG
jgi:hypothetical protein